jgi:D-alanine-D-alanine ligase-like ATP-grasp enzyme
MQIQILQGLNLENEVTTIKITLDQMVEADIIKEIHSFHPIFLKQYKIDKEELTIQSKLPHLWIEIARALNEKISKEEKRKKILQEIIKSKIKSMSTISILEVADKLNEEITPFLIKKGILTGHGEKKYNRQYAIGCGKRSAYTISFSTSKDAKESKSIQEDKYLTNLLLNRLNIPMAEWEIVKSEEHLKEIFKKYQPLAVLKPTSLTAGHGVHTNIKTLEEALKAFKSAKKTIDSVTSSEQRKKIIIQKQVKGEDYRLLVIAGKLEIATKRIPAFVEGNGKLTVEELINITNLDPRRNIYDPTHTLKPIQIDSPLIDYLEERELSLNYVPALGEKIPVRKVASMSQGGITVDFTDKVHNHIKYIAESIAQSLRAHTLGIDIICQDISNPLTTENGSVIEVNTMPEGYLNLFPVIGQQRPEVADRLVKSLLEKESPTKKIVIIGGNEKERPQFAKNTGIYYKNAVYINEEIINKDLDTREAIDSLKINAYLDNIVLHYQDLEEVKKYGFGFDKIDEIFYKKEYKNTIMNLNKNLVEKLIEF